MAKIEKMAISGLRSYSPDELGYIEFQTPLTLIVGTNGSGKTSIIECLNYVITGNFPPGTKVRPFSSFTGSLNYFRPYLTKHWNIQIKNSFLQNKELLTFIFTVCVDQ